MDYRCIDVPFLIRLQGYCSLSGMTMTDFLLCLKTLLVIMSDVRPSSPSKLPIQFVLLVVEIIVRYAFLSFASSNFCDFGIGGTQ